MGSSKTGSLDKFAKFSPAAAFGSGKVKLPGGPTGGILGMLQEDMIGSAEAKQAQNAANMQMMQQEQNQNNQYNMALQQMMMGQQQKPSPYSPAPYANGGNVTLRRKMFKLGGSASAHGTGLTSGLAFNQGGSVKPGPDGRDRVHASKAGFIADLLTGGATFVGKRGKKLYDDIMNVYTVFVLSNNKLNYKSDDTIVESFEPNAGSNLYPAFLNGSINSECLDNLIRLM